MALDGDLGARVEVADALLQGLERGLLVDQGRLVGDEQRRGRQRAGAGLALVRGGEVVVGIGNRDRSDRAGARRRAGAVVEGHLLGAGGLGETVPDRPLVADLELGQLGLLAGDRGDHEGHVASLQVGECVGLLDGLDHRGG